MWARQSLYELLEPAGVNGAHPSLIRQATQTGRREQRPQREKGPAGLACVRWTGRPSSCSGESSPPSSWSRWSSQPLASRSVVAAARVRSSQEVIDVPAPTWTKH